MKFVGIINQAEGKPVIAKSSDKRPAIEFTAVIDEFQNLNAEEEV
jgi:hypothetical protein